MVSKSQKAMSKKNSKSKSIIMKNTNKNHLNQEVATNKEEVEADDIEKTFTRSQSKKHTQELRREKNSLQKIHIATEAEVEEEVCTEEEGTEAEAIEGEEEEAEADLVIVIIKKMRKETGEETIKKKLKKHRITSLAMRGMSDEVEEEEVVSEGVEEEGVILMRTQEVIESMSKILFSMGRLQQKNQ